MNQEIEKKVTPIIPAPEIIDYKAGSKLKLYRQSQNEYFNFGPYEIFEPWINIKQELIGYIGRTNKKKPYQIFYSEKGWTQGSIGSNRPLLGEEKLISNNEVLIGEGEKVYSRLKSICKSYIPLTWVGGARSSHLTDLSVLEGKTVYILPDNDEDGFNAAKAIYKRLHNKANVKVIAIPEGKPLKWDIADDIDQGLVKDENDLQKYLCNQVEVNPYEFEEFFAEGRSPGQIVLDYFYSDSNYICIQSELYRYFQGYYEKLNDLNEYKKIAQLFNKCKTNQNKNISGYAKSTCVKEALAYVKQHFNVPYDKVNPIGLNLKNGILRPYYDQGQTVSFKLIPHSDKEFYTYQADFSYDPSADSSILDNALEQMLDEKPRAALLKNLAGVLDIDTVRKHHTRALRALILDGEGNNGKDTFRVWCSMLFGKEAFSAISLQVFKRADSERVFQLGELATSKINWSSENLKIAIDSCQTIKQIITGDPIVLEKKHQDPFTICPKIIMIFNSNDKPVFESYAEAIATRYSFIPFPYIFKTKPNLNNPYEKKADPRFKDDLEFIKQKIMPAFLNRLTKEFELLLKEGVDYSFQDSIMEEVKMENNHFYDFANDIGLVQCNLEQGLTPSSLFDKYQEWCKEQLFIVADIYRNNQYNDPSPPYDKVLRNPRQITKQLKKMFPSLKSGKSLGERRIGVKIADVDVEIQVPF